MNKKGKQIAALVLLILFSGVALSACGAEEGSRIGTVNAGTASVPMFTSPRTTATTAPQPPAAQMATLLTAFDIDREFAVLAELASDKYAGRKTGTAGAERAADYIESLFNEAGLQPWTAVGLDSLRQPFYMRGSPSENIVGLMPGSGGPGAGYVILGSHYDHLGVDAAGQAFNGADDDASGVAAVVEAVRMIRETRLKPVKNLVFVAFSGEEQGFYGSAALGDFISAAGLTTQVQMFNVDGIGAIGGDYLGAWDEGAANAAPIIQKLKEAAAQLGETVREEGTDIGSDAQSFNWQYGIPAVTIDWAWGQDPSTFHPYYHTIYDDPGSIDQGVLARASKVAIGGFWLSAVS